MGTVLSGACANVRFLATDQCQQFAHCGLGLLQRHLWRAPLM